MAVVRVAADAASSRVVLKGARQNHQPGLRVAAMMLNRRVKTHGVAVTRARQGKDSADAVRANLLTRSNLEARS